MLKNTKKLGALSTSFGRGPVRLPALALVRRATALRARSARPASSAAASTPRARVGTASNARGARGRFAQDGRSGQRFARTWGSRTDLDAECGQGLREHGRQQRQREHRRPELDQHGRRGWDRCRVAAHAQAHERGHEVAAAEPPKTYDVTPYKKEMEIAKMLVLLAAGLLYYISTLAKEGVVLKKAVGTAKGEVTAAEGKVTAAKGEVAVAKAELAAAEAALVEATATAAVPGAGQAALLAAKAKVVTAEAKVVTAGTNFQTAETNLQIAQGNLTAAQTTAAANQTLIENLCIAAGVVGAAVILGVKIMGASMAKRARADMILVEVPSTPARISRMRPLPRPR